jgi:hypothetical protein
MRKVGFIACGLTVVGISYLVFVYQNIWYLDYRTAVKLELAFSIPMLLILCSWIFYPSRIIVGILGVLSFALPPMLRRFDVPAGFIVIESILLLCLIGVTSLIRSVTA